MIVTLRNLIRLIILKFYYHVLTKLYKMDIAPSARVSLGAKLDKTYPVGIHIGKESYIASGALILSHDFCRGIRTDTYIGEKCFVGANAIIMPGIRVGDEVVVGTGSIVTKDVESNSIVAGNPAKVLKSNIITTLYGKIIEFNDN